MHTVNLAPSWADEISLSSRLKPSSAPSPVYLNFRALQCEPPAVCGCVQWTVSLHSLMLLTTCRLPVSSRPKNQWDMSTLRFGQHLIKASAVFLQTELSFALVNRKPVVPGRIFSLLTAERWACWAYNCLCFEVCDGFYNIWKTFRFGDLVCCTLCCISLAGISE